MRLGNRSKEILELMAAFSLEALDAAITLPRLYQLMSYPSERSFIKTTQLLEKSGLIQVKDSAEWVSALTSKGRSTTNNDFEPEQLWGERWDGNWRLLSFDLPTSASAERQALRRWLELYRFGRLQGSVWITPRDLGNWRALLNDTGIDSKNSLTMRGTLGDGGDQSHFVDRAWNFKRINHAYDEYLKFVGLNRSFKPNTFKSWFLEESLLWKKAFSIDPFLPKDLWTPDMRSTYLGPNALKERNRLYRKWKTELFE